MSAFILTLRCLDCGHKYKRRISASSRQALDEMPDPPCPQCRKPKRKARHTGIKGVIASGKAPAVGGTSIVAKAIDVTADIVMQDYGLSDLKSNTREGDTMVPSLTPRQRQMSENFWGGRRSRKQLSDMKTTVTAAMQGAFLPGRGAQAGEGAVSGNEILSALHSQKARPKTTIIASMDRKSS